MSAVPQEAVQDLQVPQRQAQASGRIAQPSDAPRPFACEWNNFGQGPQCPKSFNRKSDLQRHLRIHTNERPFQCPHVDTCDKSFIQRSALTVHIRTHTGEKPHKCQVKSCAKAFSDSSSLARHRRIHTGKRPYECPNEDCKKSFCRKTTLSKHLKRNHNGFLDDDLTGDDGDDGFEDEDSSSPATSETAQATQYSRSHWGLPNLDTQQLPYRQMLQRHERFEDHHIKRESSLPPTSYPVERTQSTPGYVNNYPHPNMMQGSIQNLTVTPVRHPSLMMQAAHSSHSSYDGQMPNARMIPRSDMSGSYSTPEQIMPEPLQHSPSSSTDCSPSSGSRSSGEYYPPFPRSDSYQSQPPYDASQPQVSFIPMQPTASQHSHSMRSCDIPPQPQMPSQHQQQQQQPVDDFAYAAHYDLQLQREATHQAEAQRLEQQRQREQQQQQQQLQLQQIQQMQQLQAQQQQQQQQQQQEQISQQQQQQYSLVSADTIYDYQEPELVDGPPPTPFDALAYLDHFRYTNARTGRNMMLENYYGLLGDEEKQDDVAIDGHLLPSQYAHIY